MLIELGFAVKTPKPMYCDNQTVIFIANNLTFHERTKYIEIDYHYVHDIVMRGIITTLYTPSSEQLTDISIKGLCVGVFDGKC